MIVKEGQVVSFEHLMNICFSDYIFLGGWLSHHCGEDDLLGEVFVKDLRRHLKHEFEFRPH